MARPARTNQRVLRGSRPFGRAFAWAGGQCPVSALPPRNVAQRGGGPPEDSRGELNVAVLHDLVEGPDNKAAAGREVLALPPGSVC